MAAAEGAGSMPKEKHQQVELESMASCGHVKWVSWLNHSSSVATGQLQLCVLASCLNNSRSRWSW